MKPVRVLWLTDSLALGGAEALSVAFAGAVDPQRIDLRVAFLKSLGGNPFEDELRQLGVPVHAIRARNLRDMAAFRRLLRLLRTEAIDVLHSHLAYASIWGSLASPITGVPSITTFHVAPAPDPTWSPEGLRRALRVRLANTFSRRAVAVSRAVADLWIREGLDPETIRVIPNGVRVEPRDGVRDRDVRARVRRELGIPAGSPVILTVSVLREGKGLEDLLAAMERRVEAGEPGTLLVAGEGGLREALESAIRSRALEKRVRLLGLRRDVPALLEAADLFVLPSRWDAFPTAVLEAMAAGLPVVATRVGGIPEAVEDGVTGLLVPPARPDALADAVDRVLADPGLASRLGDAGHARVWDHFSLAIWHDRLASLYEALASPAREEAA